jgi:KDO2-lipid IV(A) lauroyltransferase
MSSSQTFQPTHYLHPRHWFTWLGLGALWLLTRLPYATQLQLGAMLGTLMYHFSPKRRHVTRTNIKLVFPDLSDTEQQQLVRRTFRSVGISLLEVPLSWWGSDRKLAPLCEIEGVEHLQGALQEGRGVILLSAHFTCLEIGGRLLSQHQPFAVMYKRHRNPLFEAVMKHSRELHFQAAIQRHDVRGLVRALKQNKACWYAPDQDFGPRHSVFAPFMGINAATLAAPSRLAKMSGARVVPFFPMRRSDGRGYRLTILPPLDNFPSDDEVADATRINAIIEQQVRRAPDQYLWLHRRFKTRPQGEPGLYGWADKKRRAAP